MRLARRIRRLEGEGCKVCRTWVGRRLAERYVAAVLPHVRDDQETDFAALREAIDAAVRCSACGRRFVIPITALQDVRHETT